MHVLEFLRRAHKKLNGQYRDALLQLKDKDAIKDKLKEKDSEIKEGKLQN